MKFWKVHGLGNDFVLFDARSVRDVDWIMLTKKVCDRHTGVGADGTLILLDSDVADVRMRIINADGSEAEMCGNGIRAFSRFAFENGIVPWLSLRCGSPSAPLPDGISRCRRRSAWPRQKWRQKMCKSPSALQKSRKTTYPKE